jgi:hypothetical protein
MNDIALITRCSVTLDGHIIVSKSESVRGNAGVPARSWRPRHVHERLLKVLVRELDKNTRWKDLRSLARLIRSSDYGPALSLPVDDSRRNATIPHRRMGTPRNAPTGPHIQVQIATARKTRNGLIVSR